MRCCKLLSRLFLFSIFAFVCSCGGGGGEDSDSSSDSKGPPVPDHLPGGVVFSDTDPSAGISGEVNIVKSPNERGLTHYVLYWGSDSATKLAGWPAIAAIPKTGFNITHTFSAGSSVPSGATHILVCVKNGGHEAGTNCNIAVRDRVLPVNIAGGVAFSDADQDDGVAGNVLITRASDESDITHYVLYWGSDSTTKLAGQPAIAVIPKTASNLIYTFAANTPVPANVTHILALTRNDDGEMNSGVSVAVADKGLSLKITASDADDSDYFGHSVSISEGYILAGAPQDDDGGNQSGSAYIFKREANGTWTQKAKLTATDPAANDYFGHSVSISGNYAIAGSYKDDDAGSESGSAYIFKRETSGAWAQKAKLTAADAAAGDNFGCSVSIEGDYAVVGAYQEDDGGLRSRYEITFTF